MVSDTYTVARVDEILPGEARVFFIRGNEIAVFNVGGEFFALDNLCPHQGGPLVAGTLDGKVLTCPWHRWRFDLPSGVSVVNPAISVRAYPVSVDQGRVRIKVDNRPPPSV